jgi:hypothetical protein
MPYGDNSEKQKRYRAYLEIQAELSERPLVRVSTRHLTDLLTFSRHPCLPMNGIASFQSSFALQWYLNR